MNNRTTIFLLIGAFLLLLGIGIIQTMRDMPQAATAPTLTGTEDPLKALRENPNRVFTDFESDAIQAFSILDPYTGATFSLVKTSNNQWESPEFGTGIVSSVAEQLVFAAAVLPYLQIVEAAPPENYADFGLTQADAYVLISIVLKNGIQHGVVVGDVTSDKLGHYGLIDDRTALYVLDARPIAFMVQYLREVYGDTGEATPEAEITETPTG